LKKKKKRKEKNPDKKRIQNQIPERERNSTTFETEEEGQALRSLSPPHSMPSKP
jgi:hypothetical protein